MQVGLEEVSTVRLVSRYSASERGNAQRMMDIDVDGADARRESSRSTYLGP